MPDEFLATVHKQFSEGKIPFQRMLLGQLATPRLKIRTST